MRGGEGKIEWIGVVTVETQTAFQAPTVLDGASAGDFVALLKPRVVSLVVFTGAVGLLIAPGHLHPVLAITAILCIAIAAGAAGAINMWYDRDIDAKIDRKSVV